MKKSPYKIAKNPKDNKWYIVGYCGNGYWIPVSNGYTNKQKALTHIAKQILADKDAMRLVQEV